MASTSLDVTRPVQRGTSRSGCSSSSLSAWEFCIATWEPNAMTAEGLGRECGQVVDVIELARAEQR